jgi:hypothetical protein
METTETMQSASDQPHAPWYDWLLLATPQFSAPSSWLGSGTTDPSVLLIWPQCW